MVNMIAYAPILGVSSAVWYYMYEYAPFDCGAAIVGAYLYQYTINPDMDLLETSIKAKLKRTYVPEYWYRNPLRRFLWRYVIRIIIKAMWILWLPYALAIPHRHKVSHAPVLGTLIRFIYAFVVFYPIVYFMPKPKLELVLVFVSVVAILDMLHWLADM